MVLIGLSIYPLLEANPGDDVTLENLYFCANCGPLSLIDESGIPNLDNGPFMYCMTFLDDTLSSLLIYGHFEK